MSVDMEIEYVTFMNIATGKQYTLSYDGTTYVKDKYDGPMTMSQIKAGDIVDITFLKVRKGWQVCSYLRKHGYIQV